jgi:glycosyltransferase involved in cell wall biosynthesis
MDRRPTAVCIIDENLPVPRDPRVWREARALTEAGYLVTVICPKGLGLENAHEILDGVEIYRHPAFEASTRLGYLIEYSWALTVEFFLTIRIYTTTRFRILHASNPPDIVFLIALFWKLFGVRFVYDQHDPAPELYEAKFQSKGFFYWLTRFAERLTYRTANVVIATNDSCRDIALIRGGVSSDRIFVVHSSPALEDFCLPMPRAELKQSRKHLVVYVGIMGPQDGIDMLLESIEYLVIQNGRRDTLFVLIGPGPEQPRLKSVAAARGLEEWVRFTGGLYGDDLLLYLATADVGVAPDPGNDFNDKLTMIKILEYQACGLPVVLYDLVEGRRSAGQGALYARRNDPIDFADQIAKLLDSESLRHRLGGTGRKRIEVSLNWEIEKQVLFKAYETALRKPL